jgi:hypothetical protein
MKALVSVLRAEIKKKLGSGMCRDEWAKMSRVSLLALAALNWGSCSFLAHCLSRVRSRILMAPSDPAPIYPPSRRASPADAQAGCNLQQRKG